VTNSNGPHRRETITQKLGDKFSRIFDERGVEFFEKLKSHGISDDEESTAAHSDAENDSSKPSETDKRQVLEHPMTPDELFQMRKEMLPQLQ
jgi:mediator of RNA polymerase II transcription subunit 17, fungi type